MHNPTPVPREVVGKNSMTKSRRIKKVLMLAILPSTTIPVLTRTKAKTISFEFSNTWMKKKKKKSQTHRANWRFRQPVDSPGWERRWRCRRCQSASGPSTGSSVVHSEILSGRKRAGTRRAPCRPPGRATRDVRSWDAGVERPKRGRPSTRWTFNRNNCCCQFITNCGSFVLNEIVELR